MAYILVSKPQKILTFKNLAAIVTLLLVVQGASTAFYTLRLANYSFKYSSTSPTIIELIPEAIEVYKNREKLFLNEKISENVRSRTFILEYLADLTSRTENIEPMLGVNLLRALVVATPSILYPAKYLNPLFAPEEVIANPHFHLPIWDAANSVFTASVIDFGEFGLILLPGLLAFIYSRALRVFRKFTHPLAAMLLSFFIAKVLLGVEADITSHITAIRTLLIFFAAALVITYKYKASRHSFDSRQEANRL